DTKRFAEVISEVCAAELFAMNGGLVMPRDGALVQITPGILRDLIGKHIATARLVHADDGSWGVELFNFEFRGGTRDVDGEPNDVTLGDLMRELLTLVARGPTAPSTLSPQRRQEVLGRLRQGEPAKSIAMAYGVSADEIKQLAR